MIFVSQRANDDPEPWVSHHGRHEDPDPAGWDFDVEFSFQPRPEFTQTRDEWPWQNEDGERQALHNRLLGYEWSPRHDEFDPPVNTVLQAYRKFSHRLGAVDLWLAAHDALEAFGGYVTWDDPEHAFHVLTKAHSAEVQHARRVLTKLAALT